MAVGIETLNLLIVDKPKITRFRIGNQLWLSFRIDHRRQGLSKLVVGCHRIRHDDPVVPRSTYRQRIRQWNQKETAEHLNVCLRVCHIKLGSATQFEQQDLIKRNIRMDSDEVIPERRHLDR